MKSAIIHTAIKALAIYFLASSSCLAQTKNAPQRSHDAAKWGESELILTGIKVYQTPEEMPESITIPAPWLRLFKEMRERTDATGREHGACLKISPDPIANNKATQELIKIASIDAELSRLIGTKIEGDDILQDQINSERPPKDFMQLFLRRRKILNDFRSNKQKEIAQISFDSSSIVIGEEHRILFPTNECPELSIGLTHTHPAKAPTAIPSLADYRGFSAPQPYTDSLPPFFFRPEHKNWSNFIIGENRICATIHTAKSTYKSLIDSIAKLDAGDIDGREKIIRNFEARKIPSDLFYAAHSALARIDITTTGKTSEQIKDDKYHEGIFATIAQQEGIGFYCGGIEQTLKKAQESPINKNNPEFYVYAKMIHLSWLWSMESKNSPPEFKASRLLEGNYTWPITPELDVEYSSFLSKIFSTRAKSFNPNSFSAYDLVLHIISRLPHNGRIASPNYYPPPLGIIRKAANPVGTHVICSLVKSDASSESSYACAVDFIKEIEHFKKALSYQIENPRAIYYSNYGGEAQFPKQGGSIRRSNHKEKTETTHCTGAPTVCKLNLKIGF